MKCLMLDFNFDLNTGGELDVHKCINNLLRRLDDINQSLVCVQFKLLTAVLVLVNGAKDGNDLLLCGERYGTGNHSAISLCCHNNLLSRSVDKGVIVALESYSDFLFNCHVTLPPS